MRGKRAIAAVSCVLAVSVSALAGCGGRGVANDDQTLEVYCWQAGYGTDWVEPLLEDFGTLDWVKEKYPNYKYAKPVINDQNNFGESRVDQGAGNTIDLFFSQNMESFYGTDTLVDLTDCVYNQPVPGEDILFKDKLRPSILDNLGYRPIGNLTAEPRYYSVPWADSVGGIVYNQSLFEDLGLTVPNTTDEMFTLMENVKQGNIKNKAEYKHTYSFITTKVSYTNYMFHEWWAQYEGLQGYKNFWNGIAEDGTRNSVDIFSQQGRLKSLEIMHDIHNEDRGYYDRSSSTYEFIAGQTRLLTRDGLMMVSGSWFSNEMQDLAAGLKKEGYNDVISMMRTPVVSAIVEKTPSIVAAASAAGKTSDEMLSEVIKEVDAGATKSSNEAITQTDFNKVREARGLKFSIGATHNTVIPQAASAKELAIDFVRYLATDRACAIYAEHTCGGGMGFQYSFEEKAPEKYEQLMTQYKETFTLQSDAQRMLRAENNYILPYYGTFPLARWGGVTPLTTTYGVETGFISNKNLTAQAVWQETIDYWTENGNRRWNNALSKAGLR